MRWGSDLPFFEWRCETDGCQERTAEFRPRWTPDAPLCTTHGLMERDWHGEARRHTPGSSFPYVTSNISGTPIEVRDEGHLRELCRQHGKVLRDDAAWLEPIDERFEFGKYDHEKRAWVGRGVVQREGSGRGMKGQWI